MNYILFTSPTCAPCAAVKPLVQARAEELGLSLTIEDISAPHSMYRAYGVRAVPSLVAIHGEAGIYSMLVGADVAAKYTALMTEATE